MASIAAIPNMRMCARTNKYGSGEELWVLADVLCGLAAVLAVLKVFGLKNRALFLGGTEKA